MENLGFLLKLTINMRCSIECGESVRTFLYRYLSEETDTETRKLKIWLTYFERTKENKNVFKNNTYRILCELIVQGLEGYAILERLKSFEEELIEVCKEDLQKRLDQLPYEMMLPLLLFMFPGYLLLILGPIIVHLMSSF